VTVSAAPKADQADANSMSEDTSSRRTRVPRRHLRGTTLPALSCVAVLGLANTNWLVTRAGVVDPWVYVNYFREIPGSPRWVDYYKVSRVPWTALGHFTSSVFGLEATQWVLVLGSIVALVVLVAVLLRPFAIEAAAFGVVLVALSPLFHGSGGWLYHNTLSGPLQIAATLLGLRLALSPRWPGRAGTRMLCWFGFGFVAMTLVFTNTMQALTVAPVIGVIVIAACLRRAPWRHAVRGIALVIAGGATSFLLCALTSVASGGRFLFYLPLYRTFSSFASNRYDEAWWYPLSSGWWRDATYLVIPLGAGIIGVVQGVGWLRARRRGVGRGVETTPTNWLAFALIGANLMVVIGWIVAYFLKYHLLNWQHHSYPILLTGALSIAASVHLGLARRGFAETDQQGHLGRWFPWLAAGIPTVVLLFPVAQLSIDFSSADRALRGGLIAGLAIFVALAAAFRWARSRRTIAIVLLVSLGALIAAGSYPDYALLGKCDAPRLENSAVLDTAQLWPPGPDQVLVYARPKEVAKLGPGCSSSLTDVAASIGVIETFAQYLPAANGQSKFTPAELPALSSTETPQELLLVRSASAPARRWESSAIRALTRHHPERVIDRSVRPVGSPSGKVEVVLLTIA